MVEKEIRLHYSKLLLDSSGTNVKWEGKSSTTQGSLLLFNKQGITIFINYLETITEQEQCYNTKEKENKLTAFTIAFLFMISCFEISK